MKKREILPTVSFVVDKSPDSENRRIVGYKTIHNPEKITARNFVKAERKAREKWGDFKHATETCECPTCECPTCECPDCGADVTDI